MLRQDGTPRLKSFSLFSDRTGEAGMSRLMHFLDRGVPKAVGGRDGIA
jgi:hypothetical protein